MASINQGITRDDEPYLESPDHPLQTLDIRVQNSSPDAPWLIYIHGGAWRDPRITKTSSHPFLRQQLLLNPSLNAATLNHRLSPHPEFPGGKNFASHPDHLDDVVSALLYLKASYGLADNRYVLVGHCAGATLALQALPILYDQPLVPYAIVSVEGIYDLVDLIDEYPEYTFVHGAFGQDKEAWKIASPTFIGREQAVYADYKGKIVLLQSDEDEFLSWRQTKGFKEVLDARPGNNGLLVKAVGKHDDVIDGQELSDVVLGLTMELMPKKEEAEIAVV